MGLYLPHRSGLIVPPEKELERLRLAPHWGGGGPGIQSIYPSGFTPPPVPGGMTLKLFEDFVTTAYNGTGGSGVNAEGAVWLPNHVKATGNSILNLQAWQDTSALGQYGINSAAMANNNNWVTAQTGLNPSPAIGLNATTQILIAMRADSLPGLTALALTTGTTGWPPEIDIVEINAPMTTNSATLHYGSGPPSPPGFYPYYQVACDLTQWMIWGVLITPTTISFLKQVTPSGSLSTWATQSNPDPSGANSFGQPEYLALQYQTWDAIYSSGTPNYPVNRSDITSANPMQQQIDWVQICTSG